MIPRVNKFVNHSAHVGKIVARFCKAFTRAVSSPLVDGIRYQIEDGVNGFLVSSIEQAAERIVRLVKDQGTRDEMGKNAGETVREKFLLSRYVEQYLDLFLALAEKFRP
jgi:glycosyltransferase involved in cell wall biosynthesis